MFRDLLELLSLIKIYHSLPPFARSIAAGLRGYYLRSWRYGPESEELIAASIEREGWGEEKWRNWIDERLAYVLHRAATRVPYYRDQWSRRRISGDRASWEELKNWPILSKESLRENPLAFVADDCDPKRMFREHTSGTSGKPLNLWWSRETVRAWYALFEARGRRWHNVGRGEAWAILGGQPVIPPHTRKAPFWVWNAPMRQLYLSANHISRRNVAEYIKAIEDYGVTHLVTYSSSAAILAAEAVQLGLQPRGIKTVITNAEPLFPWQREIIRRGFGCEARETYGMAEIVAAASECGNGILHLWPEVGKIEILRDNETRDASPGEAGWLIGTGLLNADMPLIRYEVGDRLRPATGQDLCPCGRLLPMIDGIEGRTNDMLLTRDGRYVYWLNPVFYGLPIREAQIIQEEIDSIRVVCVPATGFDLSHEKTICDRMRDRMGDIRVKIDCVADIPRGSAGKFRAVICKIR